MSTHSTVDSVLLLLMGVHFISCNEAYLLGMSGFFQDFNLPRACTSKSLPFSHSALSHLLCDLEAGRAESMHGL